MPAGFADDALLRRLFPQQLNFPILVGLKTGHRPLTARIWKVGAPKPDDFHLLTSHVRSLRARPAAHRDAMTPSWPRFTGTAAERRQELSHADQPLGQRPMPSAAMLLVSLLHSAGCRVFFTNAAFAASVPPAPTDFISVVSAFPRCPLSDRSRSLLASSPLVIQQTRVIGASLHESIPATRRRDIFIGSRYWFLNDALCSEGSQQMPGAAFHRPLIGRYNAPADAFSPTIYEKSKTRARTPFSHFLDKEHMRAKH